MKPPDDADAREGHRSFSLTHGGIQTASALPVTHA